MGDVVNLRQFKKQKQRSDKSAKADQNRAKFGQSKEQTALTQKEKRRTETTLDGAHLDRDKDD